MSRQAKFISTDEAKTLLRGAKDGASRLVENVCFPPGFHWPSGRYSEVVFRGTEWFNLEVLGNVLGWIEFTNCKFESVKMDGIVIRKSRFNHCFFSDAVLGIDQDNRIERSEFLSCDFFMSRFHMTKFTDCSFQRTRFEDCKMYRTRWVQSQLNDVSFSGVLSTCVMDRISSQGLDMSSAELADCAFLECELGQMKLPDRPANFMAPPKAFAIAMIALENKLSRQSYAFFCKIADAVTKSPIGQECVHEAMFPELPKPDVLIILHELYRLRNEQ